MGLIACQGGKGGQEQCTSSSTQLFLPLPDLLKQLPVTHFLAELPTQRVRRTLLPPPLVRLHRVQGRAGR